MSEQLEFIAERLVKLDDALTAHASREEANQQKFIEILHSLKTDVQKLENGLDRERYVSEAQLKECRATLRRELIEEEKANISSLQEEWRQDFAELKRLIEQKREDIKDLYQQVNSIAKQQGVYGEYIDLVKKIAMVTAGAVTVGVLAMIGLKK